MKNYYMPVLTNAISNLLFVAIILYVVIRRVRIKSIKIDLLRNIYRDSAPFFLNNLVGIGNLYISRIILDRLATSFELAVYSFFLEIIYKLAFIPNTFYKVYIPTMRDVYHNNPQKYFKYLKQFSFIFIVVGMMILLIVILVGELLFPVLHMVIRKEYIDYRVVFYILFLAFVLSMQDTIMGAWEYVIKTPKWVIAVGVYCLILGIILYPTGYYFGKIYGLAGAYIFVTIGVIIFDIFMNAKLKKSLSYSQGQGYENRYTHSG